MKTTIHEHTKNARTLETLHKSNEKKTEKCVGREPYIQTHFHAKGKKTFEGFETLIRASKSQHNSRCIKYFPTHFNSVPFRENKMPTREESAKECLKQKKIQHKKVHG